jgi:hypothetical protein
MRLHPGRMMHIILVITAFVNYFTCCCWAAQWLHHGCGTLCIAGVITRRRHAAHGGVLASLASVRRSKCCTLHSLCIDCEKRKLVCIVGACWGLWVPAGVYSSAPAEPQSVKMLTCHEQRHIPVRNPDSKLAAWQLPAQVTAISLVGRDGGIVYI